MAKGKACGECGHIHLGTDAIAIGRFNPNGPIGYKAIDGKVFETRQGAINHTCNVRYFRDMETFVNEYKEEKGIK